MNEMTIKRMTPSGDPWPIYYVGDYVIYKVGLRWIVVTQEDTTKTIFVANNFEQALDFLFAV